MMYEVENRKHMFPNPLVLTVQPTVSVILPAYNEEAALPQVLTALFDNLDSCFEVVVVDDGSTDSTAQIASQYPCRLIRQGVNQGKGAAVRAGIAAATGNRIIIMDADNTYPAQALPKLAQLLETNDLVRCSRQFNPENIPMVNRVGNFIFDAVLKMIHGLKGNDHLTGLYGLRREALERVNFCADGFDMEVEIGIKAQAHGLKTAAFSIDYQERLGEKKLRPLHDGWRILKRILAMALLYNPVLSFILPGMILWVLTVWLLLTLHSETILSGTEQRMQNLTITVLGLSGGFQLIVFGICAGLYGLKCGVPARPWLITLGSEGVRQGVRILGTLLILVALWSFGGSFFNWLGSAGYRRLNTQEVLIAGALMVGGFQLVVASLFVSIFSKFSLSTGKAQ